MLRNPVQAASWWRKAAEQNYAPAQRDLGVCYANGLGVAKDEAEAAKWYRKAHERNLAQAPFNLKAEAQALASGAQAQAELQAKEVQAQAELQAKEAQAKAKAETLAKAEEEAKTQAMERQRMFRREGIRIAFLVAVGGLVFFYRKSLAKLLAKRTCNRCATKYSIWSARLGAGMCNACCDKERLAKEERAREAAKQRAKVAADLASAQPNPNTLFYYKVKDEEKGPYTLGQLRSMWDSGQVTADVVSRSSDSSEWFPLLQLFTSAQTSGQLPVQDTATTTQSTSSTLQTTTGEQAKGTVIPSANKKAGFVGVAEAVRYWSLLRKKQKIIVAAVTGSLVLIVYSTLTGYSQANMAGCWTDGTIQSHLVLNKDGTGDISGDRIVWQIRGDNVELVSATRKSGLATFTILSRTQMRYDGRLFHKQNEAGE
jgi:hypothetical protein